MSKRNNKIPRIVEYKIGRKEYSQQFRSKLDRLEERLLRLELATLLNHGDTDYSTYPLAPENAGYFTHKQHSDYILIKIQKFLGSQGTVVDKEQIKDILRRISRTFNADETREQELSAIRFAPSWWIRELEAKQKEQRELEKLVELQRPLRSKTE